MIALPKDFEREGPRIVEKHPGGLSDLVAFPLEELYEKEVRERLETFLSGIAHLSRHQEYLGQDKPTLFSLRNRYLPERSFQLLLHRLGLLYPSNLSKNRNVFGKEIDYVKKSSEEILALLLLSGITLSPSELTEVNTHNPSLLRAVQKMDYVNVLPLLPLPISSFLANEITKNEKNLEFQVLISQKWQEVRENGLLLLNAEEYKEKTKQDLAAKLGFNTRIKLYFLKKAVDFVFEDKMIYFGLSLHEQKHLYFKSGEQKESFLKSIHDEVVSLLLPFFNFPDIENQVGNIVPYKPHSLAAAIIRTKIANRKIEERKYFLDFRYVQEFASTTKYLDYTYQLIFWLLHMPNIEWDSERMDSEGKAYLNLREQLMYMAAPYDTAWANKVALVEGKPNMFANEQFSRGESLLFTDEALMEAIKSISDLQEIPKSIRIPWKFLPKNINENDRTLPSERRSHIFIPTKWLLELLINDLKTKIDNEVEGLMRKRKEKASHLGISPGEMFNNCFDHFESLASS